MSRQAVRKVSSYVAINLMFKHSVAGSHITKSLGRNRNPRELKYLNMTRSVLFERLPGLFLPHLQEAVRKLASKKEPMKVTLHSPRQDCPGRGVGYELRCSSELYAIIRKLKIDFQPFLEDLERYKLWYEPYDEKSFFARLENSFGPFRLKVYKAFWN
jgi:hypothetical protein